VSESTDASVGKMMNEFRIIDRSINESMDGWEGGRADG
jgi:hypothetical protein